MGRMNEILSEGGTRFFSLRFGQMIRIQNGRDGRDGWWERYEFFCLTLKCVFICFVSASLFV